MAFSTAAETKAYAKGRADERTRSQQNVNMSSPGPLGPKQSDQRFRSFAERFMIERASTFRADHITEDTWQCILDAKTAYNMIKQVGRNAETTED